MEIPYAFFQDTKWHDAPFFRFDGESVEKGHITQEELTEAKRILRELRILRYLDHPNVIRIRDVLQPSDSIFQSLCVVFDYVDLDLRKLIADVRLVGLLDRIDAGQVLQQGVRYAGLLFNLH